MDKNGIETIKRLRDACDAIIKACEAGEEQTMDAAMGKFLLTLMQFGALN